LTSEEQMKQDISNYMTNMCSHTQDFISLRVAEGKQVVQALSVGLSEKLTDFKVYMKETAKRFQKKLKKQKSSLNNRSTHDSLDSFSIGQHYSQSHQIPISKSSSFSASSDSSTTSSSGSSFNFRQRRMNSYRQQGSRVSFY
jgi:hypothetical protein